MRPTMVYDDFDPDLDIVEKAPRRQALEVDPVVLQHYIDLRRSKQHLPLAVIAGTAGAAAGVTAWVGITMLVKADIGWAAVGVGLLAGSMVRVAGRGIDRSFGYTAAIITLAGYAVAILLSGCWLVAQRSEEATFQGILTTLTPEMIVQVFSETRPPTYIGYYVAGLIVAYWIAIRRIRRHEKEALAAASANIEAVDD